MDIRPFALERYFAASEFTARHLLCASDPEPPRMSEILALADDECREWWDRLSLGYTESAGAPLLRAEISGLYETLDPDDVLTLVGAQEGIFLAMHAMLHAGDEVIVTTPAYQSLHEVARSIGATVRELPLDPDRGWEFPLDLLRRTISQRTKLLVINFPNNPTGALVPHDVFAAIVALCAEHGVHLLSDEVYRMLEYDVADRLPAAADAYPRALSLGVMSKPFGLAGLRLGWIATRDRELLARIAMLKDYTTICGSAPGEVLALIALRSREALLARTLGIVQQNLALLDDFFARNAERIRWTRPRAGTVAAASLNVDARVFAEQLMAQSGVLLLPGDVFELPATYFRLGFGRRDLPQALPFLEAELSQRRSTDAST